MKRITRISSALLLSCLPLLSGCIYHREAGEFPGSGILSCMLSLRGCVSGGIPHDVKLAAEQGDADAQYQMGQAYDYGKVVHGDFRRAAKWYQMAAQQGHADAQYQIGYMHHVGKLLTLDGKEALRWYQMAAAQGNAKATAQHRHAVPRGNWRSRRLR